MNQDSREVEKFIHALSHDIKNVLHNIQGYADLLEDENNPEFLEGIIRLVKKAREILDEYVALADNGEYAQRPRD